jgi:microcystin degradation protein MlrC
MQWIIGAFAHETNTFSSVPTDLEAFAAHSYAVGTEVEKLARGTRTGMGGFIDAVEARSDTFISTTMAHATPSGLVTAAAFEEIAAHIVDGVRQNPQADGVLLSLHGAMVAQGFDDGEGELLRRVRQALGPIKPIVVTLDLHSHITQDMLQHATMLVGYQKYPHTDMHERGVEAVGLAARIAQGRLNPVAALEKPPLIPPCATCHTEAGLYRELWQEALRPQRPATVVSTSLFAGFPYADIPPLGFAVLVYTDNDAQAAQTEASHLSAMVWERRREFGYTPTPPAQAVQRALAHPNKPVVIPDIADNPGGGGANDSVEILRHLLEQKASKAAVAAIYDPDVAHQAAEAGIGGSVKADLGAKTDALHGKPLAIEGTVRFVGDGRFQYKGEMSRGAWANMGRCAVLQIEGVAVVVCSQRLQQRDPEVFHYCGIDPQSMDILVVKSAVHFRAAFASVAGAIVEADGPGLTALDLQPFPFKRITRPIFPLDLI